MFWDKNLALHQFESRNNICEKLHLKYRNKTIKQLFYVLYNFKSCLIAFLTFIVQHSHSC